MSILKNLTYILFVIFFAGGFSQTAVFAQSKKQKALEQQRTKLQKEIKRVNQLLFNNQKKEKNLLQQIRDLKTKMGVRNKLIQAIENEANDLSKSIDLNTDQINKLNKELDILKSDYADMIYMTYKSKSIQSKLLFILSSDSFLQAYKRIQYLKQYASYRKSQGEKITLKKIEINQANQKLIKQKEDKEALISSYTKEKETIELEKSNQEKLVKSVKKNEKKYIAEIKKKQAQERKIDKEIEKLIKAAIAASNKKEKTKSSRFKLTPEAKALANKFELNKGKLPWPVKNGLVTRRYGKIPHETLRGITLQSNGIHIATDANAEVRTIFEGKVLAIQKTSNGIKTIMVQHGNYISLYSNLKSIQVIKGQKLGLQQSIGTVHTNKVSGKSILKFQIWRDTKKQNPQYWLLKL